MIGILQSFGRFGLGLAAVIGAISRVLGAPSRAANAVERPPTPERPRRRSGGRRRAAVVLTAGATALVFAVIGAVAYWTTSGSGTATAGVGDLSAATISASTTIGTVTVNWDAQAAMTPASESTSITYTVERKFGAGSFAGITSGPCSGSLAYGTSSCTDPISVAGSYTYRVVAHFSTAWTAESNEVTLSVITDADAPSTTITFPLDTGVYSGVSFTAGCVPTGICGTATDATGVDTVRVSVQQIGGGYWTGADFSGFSEYFIDANLLSPGATSTGWSLALPLPADGQYTVHAQAKDTVGNDSAPTNTSTATFVIDTTGPTTTLTTSPPSPDGDNAWFQQASVSFTLSANDPAPGSGVASTMYTVDGGPAQTYTGAVTISTQGDHTITYWSTDNAGNPESINTAHIKLDNVTPSTTIAIDPASPDGSNGWRVSATTFTLSASDATSGVASTKYQIDSGAITTYSGNPVALPEGQHTVSYWSVDTAGNIEATHTTATIKVDTVKPSTTLTTSPASPDGTNGWFNQSSVSFTLNASDSSSGVASRLYTIDGGGTQTYTGAVTINTQGDHTVTFWSVDDAGNVEATNTTHIKLDGIAPATTLATSPASPDGTNGWFKQSSVNFTLAVTEATSGVASTSYTIDGGGAQPYTGAVTINTQGDHTVTYWSTDNAGNVESTHTIHIKLDNVTPVTAITINPASPDGSSGWRVSTTTFTLSASDASSGVASIKYQIDGGATQNYGGAVGIAEGSHTVTYWAVDNAGNTEGQTTTATIKVDTVKPSTSIAISPAAPNGSNGWYKTTAPTFTLTSTDATSGVASRHYQIDGGATQAYSSAVTIPQGQHTITYWAVDSAGNTETAATTATIKVDTVSPTDTLSLASSPAPVGAFLSAANVLYFKGTAPGSFTLVGSVTDATSGGASATFPAIATTNWTGAGGTDSSAPYTAAYSWASTTNVPTNRTVTSLDVAGNPSAGASVSFVRDVTAPISGSVTYTNTYVTTTNVTVTFSAGTDAGSGVDTAGAQLQRASATLTNNVCGSFGGFTTIATGPTSPYNDSTVASANCYQYRYVVADNVTNSVTYTSPNVAKVDAIAPTGSLTAPANGAFVHTNSVTVSSNSADTGGSGVLNAQFQRSPVGAGTWTLIGTDSSATGGWSVTWNTTSGTPDGQYDLRVITTDNAGNTFTSALVTVTVDNTRPTITTLTIANKAGGVAGKVEPGDSVTIVFSEALDQSSLCSVWTDDSLDRLLTNVSVTLNGGSGSNDDALDGITSTTCTGGGTNNWGDIALGNNGYVSGGDAMFTNSTLTWNATTFTLTITLGTQGGSGTTGTVGSDTATYTADSAVTDRAGNTVNGTKSHTGVHF